MFIFDRATVFRRQSHTTSSKAMKSAEFITFNSVTVTVRHNDLPSFYHLLPLFYCPQSNIQTKKRVARKPSLDLVRHPSVNNDGRRSTMESGGQERRAPESDVSTHGPATSLSPQQVVNAIVVLFLNHGVYLT